MEATRELAVYRFITPPRSLIDLALCHSRLLSISYWITIKCQEEDIVPNSTTDGAVETFL